MAATTDTTKILLVEDDAKLARLVKEYLESYDFSVTIEPRGDNAVKLIVGGQPDLVILDIMLPGKDGKTVCREVRPQYDGPIIMLTALGDETDEVVGLEIGADDYLIKPVAPRLLLSRINALLRRMTRTNGIKESAATATPPSKINVGTLQIDAGNRLVTVEGKTVHLTTAEFDLLYYLALQPGRVLTREQIYTDIRGIEYDGLDRSIDLRIAHLRSKLGDDGKQPRRIISIRGSGYLLTEDQ